MYIQSKGDLRLIFDVSRQTKRIFNRNGFRLLGLLFYLMVCCTSNSQGQVTARLCFDLCVGPYGFLGVEDRQGAMYHVADKLAYGFLKTVHNRARIGSPRNNEIDFEFYRNESFFSGDRCKNGNGGL
jgi:hypothetical protein